MILSRRIPIQTAHLHCRLSRYLKRRSLTAYEDRPRYPAMECSMDGLLPAHNTAQGETTSNDPALTHLGSAFAPPDSPVMQHFRFVYYGKISVDPCPAQVSQGSNAKLAFEQAGSDPSLVSAAEDSVYTASQKSSQNDGHSGGAITFECGDPRANRAR
jgi:hypothetical protein